MAPAPRRETLHLCIDGGGTKTHCAIASTSSGVLARGFAGTSNIAEVGLSNTMSAIKLATERAIAALPVKYVDENAFEALAKANSLGRGHISKRGLVPGERPTENGSRLTNGMLAPPAIDTHTHTNGNGNRANHHSHSHSHSHTPSPPDSPSSSSSSKSPSPPKTPDPADMLDLRPDRWVVERSTAPHVPTCPIRFGSVWVGLAGVDAPSDAEMLAVPLSQFFGLAYGAALVIQNDAALLAAPIMTNGSEGGLTIVAGTGSICLAWSIRDGMLSYLGRRGGTGFLLGDEGSAFHIGRTALRAVVDDFDSGAEEGRMHAMIRERFGVKTTDGLLAKVYELDETKSASVAANQRKLAISELSRAVVKCAFEYDDERAKGVLRETTHELALQAISLARGSHLSPDRSTLCLGGGLMGLPHYRAYFLEALAALGIVFSKVEYIADAAGQGAKTLARCEVHL